MTEGLRPLANNLEGFMQKPIFGLRIMHAIESKHKYEIQGKYYVRYWSDGSVRWWSGDSPGCIMDRVTDQSEIDLLERSHLNQVT